MKTFKEVLEVESKKEYFIELQIFLDQEYQEKIIYPQREDIYNAIRICELEDVKVLILGQDPYHGPNQAHGLAFSVQKGVKIPPSLVNIFKEVQSDMEQEVNDHGDLTYLARQGVCLLNTVFTVPASTPNGHAKKGWEQFSDAIIDACNQREKPMVFILWGKNAISKAKYIDQTKHCVLTSVHPSPLSAYRGFFGSKPFSKANEFLIQHHQEPIHWGK
ncbi:uracil-DNA glycosylase [Tannockella kyphosi]|uniref:uracil-DNA glycosylase n=1 Tax=Tannockella kyphosi TaxID=2899121 RepID=UPI00201299D6|nr:uracil-DNA glycosylase [Tannockella kyphosi]